MANNNIIDILGRLERRKQEQEARLESLQLKARTLKRRREELGQSLADISQQSDAREAGVSAARTWRPRWPTTGTSTSARTSGHPSHTPPSLDR